MTDTWNVLFDLDDTLIHCNKYFDIVIDKFADHMEQWFSEFGLTRETIKKKQTEIDLAGIDLHGFKVERFPESFAETYDYYCKEFARPSDLKERLLALEIGYSVYESEFELYPDVVETLTKLQEAGHTLSLYTGGDERVQRKKVEKVNLSPFFEDRIFVATHKNSEALANVLRRTNADKAVTWMVGNSLRTDIVPAIENGIGAVYIPPLSNWAYDLVEIDVKEDDRLFRADSITRVPSIIAHYYLQGK
ncbi:HAD family hydrolase [Paenibacillus thermotolerans]|uniref:HAD family hydrolase n=1 Tax=Paenibacillus thermotolerans TaxID=3027807 RepID=UPI002368BB12|nr:MULTISPECIES: HAD family hydrolase [unclassified Paenibacillus]